MRSIWKASNLGVALMAFSPILALGFGWEAFFPVALTSVLGGTICLMGEAISTHTFVAQLKADLLQDLASADQDRRDLVLAGLMEEERNWFLAELRRARAELRSLSGRRRADWCASVRCGRRFRYS
jgi:hypothetical protein